MNMELWVYEPGTVVQEDGTMYGTTYRKASPAEVLAYVATLPVVQVFDTPRPTSGPWLKPGRYLVVPWPEKEDEG